MDGYCQGHVGEMEEWTRNGVGVRAICFGGSHHARQYCAFPPPTSNEALTSCTSRNICYRIQLNKPTAGARTVKELDVGTHPLQLYSMATPNGQKVTIALEEMGLKYDAWYTNIMSVSSRVLSPRGRLRPCIVWWHFFSLLVWLVV